MLTNFHAKTCIPLICGMWLLPFNWDSVNMPSYMAWCQPWSDPEWPFQWTATDAPRKYQYVSYQGSKNSAAPTYSEWTLLVKLKFLHHWPYLYIAHPPAPHLCRYLRAALASGVSTQRTVRDSSRRSPSSVTRTSQKQRQLRLLLVSVSRTPAQNLGKKRPSAGRWSRSGTLPRRIWSHILLMFIATAVVTIWYHCYYLFNHYLRRSFFVYGYRSMPFRSTGP